LHSICESGSSVVMTTHNLQLLREYPGRVYRCSEHHINDVTDEFTEKNN
jgi:cell division transport system ATP-binding protein